MTGVPLPVRRGRYHSVVFCPCRRQVLVEGQSQKWSQWERQVAPRLPDIITVLWLMAQQMEGNNEKQ